MNTTTGAAWGGVATGAATVGLVIIFFVWLGDEADFFEK